MIEITLTIILLAIFSGFIKGFAGFGLTLVLMAVLFEVTTPTNFMPIIVPLFVFLDILLYFENRKNLTLDFKENFTLHPTTLMTLFIGILFGTYLLTKISDPSILKLIFAFLVLILLFLLVEKVDLHQMKIPSERSNGFFGLGTGILTGLFTMNGIPTTIYLLYHQYSKEKYMANLVTFLIFSDIILIAVYLFKDLFTLSGFLISMELMAFVVVGFVAGIYVRRYISSKTFKSLVILILAINSLKIIFDYFVF